MGRFQSPGDRMRLSGESARKAFSRRIHFRRREPDYVEWVARDWPDTMLGNQFVASRFCARLSRRSIL